MPFHDELSAQKELQFFKRLLLRSATIDEVTICRKLTLLSYFAYNLARSPNIHLRKETAQKYQIPCPLMQLQFNYNWQTNSLIVHQFMF